MKKLYAIFLLVFICSSVIAAQEKDKSVELQASIGWTFGCYKEMTFANISESLMSPRYQLEAKIKSGNFMHVITADYFFSHPKSAMTTTAVVYKNYDPVSGETYYEAFDSNLSFHKIRLQYDLMYSVLKDKNQDVEVYRKIDLLVGGNFVCNAFLQFEHYPSITGLVSFGPSCAMNYKINERNSILVSGGFPLLGYGVRPSYAGCDAKLMKYAEENFFKILTLGSFLSIHNYQSILLNVEYKLKASELFSTGLGFDFEYARIAVPKEKPLYYVNGNLKTFVTFSF